MGAPPTAAMMIGYRVADWDQWKATFDAGAARRAESGFTAHHVNRSKDDPNALMIYLGVSDVDAAKAYAQSDDVKALMADAGVVSEPDIQWATPRAESVVWDRELPAVVISHTVADFEAWLEGYQSPEADAMRTAAGVVGHAANQSLADPNLAIVYHQAESFDQLEALTSSNELKDVMKAAGVTSEPEFTYVTGGWGQQY